VNCQVLPRGAGSAECVPDGQSQKGAALAIFDVAAIDHWHSHRSDRATRAEDHEFNNRLGRFQ
jgi:hypothetical protein